MNDHDQPGNVALDTRVADLTITPAERDVLRRLGERVMAFVLRYILNFTLQQVGKPGNQRFKMRNPGCFAITNAI